MNIERSGYTNWAKNLIQASEFNENDSGLLLSKAESIFTIADKNDDNVLDSSEKKVAETLFSRIINFVQKARFGLGEQEGGDIGNLLRVADVVLKHADKMPILDENIEIVQNPDGELEDNKISGNELDQHKDLQNSGYAILMEDSRLAAYNLKFHPADANTATIEIEGETVLVMRNKDGGYTILRANGGEPIAHSKTYGNLDELMFDLQNLANLDPPFGTYKGLDIADYDY